MADTASEKPEENATEPEVATEKAEEAQPPKEMRAVVTTAFGGLKYVKLAKKPEPVAGDGEVLVRVKSCGINFLDLMLVKQGADDNSTKSPLILGFECAGEIEAAGENVTTYKPGDKVVLLTESKAWAELVVIPTKYVYKLPVGMSFQDAAAITMNFVTAYILLFDIGGLQKGKSVLVHSAAGGVGQAIAQLCKTVEDVTVLGVCSQTKHEAIKDTFTHLFDRSQDYSAEVKKISPDGVDLVLDCLCGEDCNRGYSLLKPMGKYVLYGVTNVTGEAFRLFNLFGNAKAKWQMTKVNPINPIKLYEENKSVAGFNLRHLLFQQGQHDYVRSVVEKVLHLWQNGKIKSVIDSTWALEDIVEAMQKIHDRKNVGKIVIDMSMEPKPKPPPQVNKETQTN
uniref:Enoyl reductase (ER) domain-containing protein n=1 Tax=Strigamia maritima TaxID=126957 RepID=T1IYY4_STRMM